MTNTTATVLAPSGRPKPWMSDPATVKQVATVETELGRRQIPVEVADLLRGLLAAGTLTKGQASAGLDLLFDAPFIPKAPVYGTETMGSAVTEEGIYERGDKVYWAIRSATGRFYAKVLDQKVSTCKRLTEEGKVVNVKYVYTAGAIGEITAEDKVTPKRAEELGHITAICVHCGTKLEDALSVKRGIGPSCWKKYGHA
jgi:hypothetical protein